MNSKIVICPICGKKTLLRIQDGGYLNSYPIRVNCFYCHALLKGVYVIRNSFKQHGLIMFNADIEEPDIECSVVSGVLTQDDSIIIQNADYVAEISGELPCKHIMEYKGGLPSPIFLNATDNLGSIGKVEERKKRLTYFNDKISDWNRTKSTAFQLLDEGSIEFISIALNSRYAEYYYECDHYLKSLHCLQEIVLDESKYIFIEPDCDTYIIGLLEEIAKVDKEELHKFCVLLGGSEELLRSYRKAINVFSSFMGIYENVLPAETFMRFKSKSTDDKCISTCSFSDIKSFYQDSYESLLSLLHIPVCFDNFVIRNDFQKFNSCYDDTNRYRGVCKGVHSFDDYRKLDNGTRVNKMNSEPYQKLVDIPANRLLRNGIGHNNIKYDGISQDVTAYDLKYPQKATTKTSLMEMAVDCIGLARSSVVFSELILFMLREEFRRENVTSITHPRFYDNIEPNMKCPCGSDKKYKKCCRNAFDILVNTNKKI